MIARVALAWGLVCLTAGCGFHPLYQGAHLADGSLASVYVATIPNRPGQLLRQAIQARLEGAGGAAAKRYTLSVFYYEFGQGVGVEANNFTTRTRSIAGATWILHEVDNNAVQLASGTVRSVDGYNLIDEQFFYADLSEDAVQHRLAEAIADQIALGLSVYFDKHPAPAKG